MAAEVKLTITRGLSEGKVFVFRDRALGAIGRADDCLLRVPNNLAHLEVSRHHCLLDIDPPVVRVRDLGSKNGTYVNGAMIGRREWGLPPEAGFPLEMPELILEDGDELGIGGTAFRVGISAEEEGENKERQTAEREELLVG